MTWKEKQRGRRPQSSVIQACGGSHPFSPSDFSCYPDGVRPRTCHGCDLVHTMAVTSYMSCLWPHTCHGCDLVHVMAVASYMPWLWPRTCHGCDLVHAIAVTSERYWPGSLVDGVTRVYRFFGFQHIEILYSYPILPSYPMLFVKKNWSYHHVHKYNLTAVRYEYDGRFNFLK